MTKRRRRTRYAIDEFFEKYPSADLNEPAPHIRPGFETGLASTSITDFNMSAAPAGYPDRAVHDSRLNAGATLNLIYGIAYPPARQHHTATTAAVAAVHQSSF